MILHLLIDKTEIISKRTFYYIGSLTVCSMENPVFRTIFRDNADILLKQWILLKVIFLYLSYFIEETENLRDG